MKYCPAMMMARGGSEIDGSVIIMMDYCPAMMMARGGSEILPCNDDGEGR